MTELPYGANAQMHRWMAEQGLDFAPRAHCLHWLAKGRCGMAVCRMSDGNRDYLDHVSGWIGKDGERLLISQPYDITAFRQLADDCSALGVKAVITGTGWYGHGTVCVWFRKHDDPREEP
jgi:hypothetical protein